MKLARILSAIVLGLALHGAAHAQPVAQRTEDIYVAVLGPSVENIVNQIKGFVQTAGRQVTSVQVIQTAGFGKVTGVRMVHTLAKVPAKWTYQDVYVAPIGDVYGQAWQIVRFQQMASKPLVDVQIIQTIGTGKVTGLRLYFAEP